MSISTRDEQQNGGLPTEARLVDIVFPNELNHMGTLFGGQTLALMDKAALIAASRFARTKVVTASSERVDFHEPVRPGDIVECVARIVATGRTSMTINLEVHAEDLATGERRLATRGIFVLVALDERGKATPVPSLGAQRSGQYRAVRDLDELEATTTLAVARRR